MMTIVLVTISIVFVHKSVFINLTIVSKINKNTLIFNKNSLFIVQWVDMMDSSYCVSHASSMQIRSRNFQNNHHFCFELY